MKDQIMEVPRIQSSEMETMRAEKKDKLDRSRSPSICSTGIPKDQ